MKNENILTFELAKIKNLNLILDMYTQCTERLQNIGINQWHKDYPNKNIVYANIKGHEQYLIKEDDNIIGTFCLSKEDEILNKPNKKIKWTNNNFIFLHRLCVKLEKQNLGYGKRIMNDLERYCRYSKINSIRLVYFNDNFITCKMYTHLHYQVVGEYYEKTGKIICVNKVIK